MLRFEFRIVNEDDECIASDWTTFSPDWIDLTGAVETVDMQIGAALRYVRRRHIAGKLTPTEEPEAA